MLDKLEVRVLGPTLFRPEFASLYSDLRNDSKGPFRRRGRHYQLTGDLREYGYDVILHLHNRHGKGGVTGIEAWCGKCEKRMPHKVTNQELGMGVCVRCPEDAREEKVLPIDSVRGEGNHKVEFVDSGKRSFASLMHDLNRIFDVNPLKCGVMRVDCAADVAQVPVTWFQRHGRIRWKRFANQMGRVILEVPEGEKLFFSRMGMTGIETIYFGKRPNCYRIYDKLQEWRVEYRKRRAKSSAGMIDRMMKAGASPDDIAWRLESEGLNPDAEDHFPSFREIYGVEERGHHLTRCERQIGGGELPTIPIPGKPAREWERLETLADVKKRILDFDPYRDIQIVEGSASEPSYENYGLSVYMSGMYLRQRIESDGMQPVVRWLNSHRRVGSKRSGSRAKAILERYAEFVPQGKELGLQSARELYERYRYSAYKQLLA